MKRSPGLRALSSEHHTALVLARRATLAADRGENLANAWHEVVQYFEAELEQHFRTEESLLLATLEHAGETALVQRTRAEHMQLHNLVHGQVHDAETLRSFARLLQAHVRFEERELFVIAQARLPELLKFTPESIAPAITTQGRQD